MNTPSHHRVHHGTNPQYIDKNYGGIFIVWDRIFGTFVEEQEEPLFGIMKPLGSWNPITANVKPLADLMSASLSMPRFTDKFRVWVAEPGWAPGGVVAIPFPAPNRGYDKDESPSLHVYAMAHLLPVSIATGCVIAFVNVWPTSWLAVGAAYIFWTCMGWVGIFEGTAWAREWSCPALLWWGRDRLLWLQPRLVVKYSLALLSLRCFLYSAFHGSGAAIFRSDASRSPIHDPRR